MGWTARMGRVSWRGDQAGMRRFTWRWFREAGTIVGGSFISSVLSLTSFLEMSRQMSGGSAGEYQADEQAGVGRL